MNKKNIFITLSKVRCNEVMVIISIAHDIKLKRFRLDKANTPEVQGP